MGSHESVLNDSILYYSPKFQFGKGTVAFAGLTILQNGVIPSAKRLSATSYFPKLTDLTSARSWFGIINQVAWAYSVSSVMQPLRDLIRPNQKCYWDNNLNKLFESSNQVIIDLVKEGVQSFDLTRQTCMEPDWSVDGVGYFLLQKHCDCSKNSLVCCKEGWRQIFAGSRFTKPTERNC